MNRKPSLPTTVLAAMLCAAYLAPVLFMAVASLKPDEDVLVEASSVWAFFPRNPTAENYSDALRRAPVARYARNSGVITATILLTGLVVNSLAGYTLARMRWPGRRLALAFVFAVMLIPFEAIAIPLFYAATIAGLRDTYTAQILPFIANAFSVFLFYSFFLDLPRDLEDAASIDGAGPWRTFWRIIAPMSGPAYAAAAIVTFLFQWGMYLWPLLVTSGPEVRPLPLGIAEFKTLPPLQWGDIMAFGVLMVGPVVAVYLVFQRWFVASVASTGLKG